MGGSKKKNAKSERWPRTEPGPKTSIVIVIQESGDHVYLAPKPGGERAKRDRKLALVVVNLTGTERRVEIEFNTWIDNGRPDGIYQFTVQSGGTCHEVAKVRKSIFDDVPLWKDVITVPYTVWVDGIEIDPDLEIER